MKCDVKETIKNKVDKMADLIIDEIGPSGQKRLTTSLIDDRRKDTKYIIEIQMKSGDPDTLTDFISDEDIPAQVEDLMNRVTALEEKEDADTIYDDTELRDRIIALENREDSDTVYDDTGIRARVTALEQKQDKDTVYDDTELRNRVEVLESKVD